MAKTKEKIAKWLFFGTACISILAVVLICVFLFARGIPAIAEIGVFDFLLGETWKPASELYGIASMIIGSIYVTVGAVIVGVPLGILTAVYMSRFAGKRVLKVLTPVVNLMAGIPSVVYGFFGMMVLVPLVRNVFGGTGNSILTASILLGIMILPTIITVSKAAIDAVPQSYYEGAIALGATHEQSVLRVVLPAAKSGVVSSVILGIGRAVGETMAVMMVAGNQPRITFDILSGIRTLTTNIAMDMGYAADLHAGALIATAVVLFVLVLIINLLFTLVKEKERK